MQRSFTRKLVYCCNLVSKSCDDRLTYLGLQRLELRRIYTDLIYMFKLIHNNIFPHLLSMFSNLIIRFIVEKQEDTESDTNCFLIVVISWFSAIFLKISIWNHLPDSCFNGDTLFYIKNQLHNTDFSRFLYGN